MHIDYAKRVAHLVKPTGKSLELRTATVTTGGLSATIDFGYGPVDGVHALGPYFPVAGDAVQVLCQGDRYLILGSIAGGWAPYDVAWTATTTNPVWADGGNGLLSGRYRREGDWCHARVRMIPGTGTTFGSGTYRWSLPFPADDHTGSQVVIGFGVVHDTSANQGVNMQVALASNVDGTVGLNLVRSALAGGSATTPTSPFTWAVGDIVDFQAWYRVLS